MSESVLLNTEQAAKKLGGLSRRTLEHWRVIGKGPRYIKLGHQIRYRQEDLDAYLTACEQHSTSENRKAG